MRRKLEPVHPGEILLEEFLSPLGISQYRLAKDVGVPPRRINEIVRRQRSITADTALRLARYFHGAPSRMVDLRQTATYDLDRLTTGVIMAFQDGQGFVLGLGVVEEVNQPEGVVAVCTPWPDLEDAMSVRFGTTCWDLVNQREI